MRDNAPFRELLEGRLGGDPLERLVHYAELLETWSARHNLNDKKVVLYSGALGLKHNPDLLLGLAKELYEYDRSCMLVVISEGYGADWLERKNDAEKLPNLLLLPFTNKPHFTWIN